MIEKGLILHALFVRARKLGGRFSIVVHVFVTFFCLLIVRNQTQGTFFVSESE